jgi:SulP family sulfate permease
MVALILINGLNATLVLTAVGLLYILAGLYFRIPMPVQPLKAVAAIAIALGLSPGVIAASGLIMGGLLLTLSFTNLISVVARLFPRAVIRGIQLSVGLLLLKRGVEFALGDQVFATGVSTSLGLSAIPIGVLLAISPLLVFCVFRFILFKRSQRFSPPLALVILGLGAGALFGPTPGIEKLGPSLSAVSLPSAADYWIALTVLVVPQLPLTLGNAVVGTWDTARTYFGDGARRVSPRALATSMGVANMAAGLVGAMPMCHGSGGLTAHYKLGARTGGAAVMLGGLLLAVGLLFGQAAPAVLSLIPLSVLGVMLAIVGVYHGLLARDIAGRQQLLVAASVTIVALALGNLAFGFGAGILLHYAIELYKHHRLRRLEPMLGAGHARRAVPLGLGAGGR